MTLNGESLFHYSAEGHPDVYRGKPVTWYAPRILNTLGDTSFTYNNDGLFTGINGRPHFYSADGRLIYDTVLQYFYDESGSLLGFSDGLSGPRYLYRRDALGNIIAILDNTGNIVVKYRKDHPRRIGSKCYRRRCYWCIWKKRLAAQTEFRVDSRLSERKWA